MKDWILTKDLKPGTGAVLTSEQVSFQESGKYANVSHDMHNDIHTAHVYYYEGKIVADKTYTRSYLNKLLKQQGNDDSASSAMDKKKDAENAANAGRAASKDKKGCCCCSLCNSICDSIIDSVPGLRCLVDCCC